MNYTAITQLKLKEAFKDNYIFNLVNEEKQYIDKLFETSNRGKLYVYDDANKGHCVITNDTRNIGSNKLLEVINSEHKNIFLLHIDGILFSKDSKCDCALITISDLQFVEFKTEALQNSNQAIEDNYNKACNQLSTTFKEFKERCSKVNVDISDLIKVKAYAVFNKTVPANSATQKKLRVKFLEDNGIPLIFSNVTNL